MAMGKECNLKRQSCETFSPQRSAATTTFPSTPVRHLCPTRGSNALGDPHGFTHHLSHKSNSTHIFLNFLFRKLSVQVTGTVTCLQPLLRCLNLLILLLVFSKADKESFTVCINLTFLLMPLLLVLSSPSLTIVFYYCLQIRVCKMCLSPASSHSHSVMWSSHHLFHHI